jgi:hypothetical protein
MNYSKVLPATGGSGLLIGGIVIGQAWLLGVAMALVLAAAVLIRMTWRRQKHLNEI